MKSLYKHMQGQLDGCTAFVAKDAIIMSTREVHH